MFFYYLDLAWRSIRRTPFTSGLMVLAISIGVGMTITTLNVYQMMSVNPAGERAGELFALQLESHGIGAWDDLNPQITYPDALNLRNSAIPTRQAAMYRAGVAVQSEDPEFNPILEAVRLTDHDFFAMFSVPFRYGSPWSRQVDQDPAYQVVLSEDLNQQMFAGENSVGRRVFLNGDMYQVVGVTAAWAPSPRYYDVNNGAFREPENLYIPLSLTPLVEYPSWGSSQSWKHEGVETFADKLKSESHWIQYWVELNSPEQVAAYQEWGRAYIEQQKQLGRYEIPKARMALSDVGQWLQLNRVVPEDNKILVGLSVLFLLVCLVNTLGLVLAKFLKRAPEIGVRRAIGASSGQIFLQHLVEVGLMGLFGGLFGLLLANGALTVLGSRFDLEQAFTQLDPSMWIASPAIAITAAVLAGLYPAWRICRTSPSIYLKSQ